MEASPRDEEGLAAAGNANSGSGSHMDEAGSNLSFTGS
ncbi:hypothetical protein ACP70R_027140 [Stipagrostis hirtigluma subsp. patula]